MQDAQEDKQYVEIRQPIYQPIKNKLLNQMLGQIKVLHKCNESQAEQCVYLEDLEKHIENKCNGFEIECFACDTKIKTLKKLEKHIKYECSNLKINCHFCGNWMSRQAFKDNIRHHCNIEIEHMIEKF